MSEEKLSLRDVLIEETKALKGVVIEKKAFVKKITEKHPNFSQNYVKMYLSKCIVNNKNREAWGQGPDLFAETEDHKLVSSKKQLAEYPCYKFDKEKAKAKKEKENTGEKPKTEEKAEKTPVVTS